MDSNQTLHDFVLNLITNPDARSAFQLDPEGTLNQAGLGDITAADVQDVVPLVVDYAAVPGVAGGLAPVGGEPDLGLIDTDPTDVIGQLQAVTERLAAQPTSVDASVAASGAVAFDSATFSVAAVTPAGVGVAAGPTGVSADLSGAADLAGTLDAAVVDPVTADATGALGATGGLDTGGLDGVLGNVGATGNGLPGLDDPLGLVESLDVTEQLPVTTPELNLEDPTSAVSGATGTVGGTLDSVGAGGLLGGGDSTGGAPTGGLLDDATDILF